MINNRHIKIFLIGPYLPVIISHNLALVFTSSCQPNANKKIVLHETISN